MKELSFLLDTHSYGFIRNNFSFFLQLPQGQEVYHHYVELLEYEEQQSGLCALPKLTKVHIYPNAFQKMSVKLAVQVRYLMFWCYNDIKKLLLHLTHKEMCQEKFLISSSVNPQLQPWNSIVSRKHAKSSMGLQQHLNLPEEWTNYLTAWILGGLSMCSTTKLNMLL